MNRSNGNRNQHQPHNYKPFSTPHRPDSQSKGYPFSQDLGHQNMDKNKFERSKKFELLWIKILKLIHSGMYQKQIAEALKMRKNTLKYHIDKLLSFGFIEREFRSSFVKFRVTNKGKRFMNLKFNRSSKFSLRVRDASSRLHNLKIKFPILEDQDKGNWEKETPINNWIKKFSYIDLPVKITIEKTPTHIIAHFHQYETSRKMFLTEFFSWVMRGTFYLYYYLIREKGIKIDVFSGEVINQHIANHTPEHEKNVDKQMTLEISLNRNAQSIMKTNMLAKAWIDRSEGPLEIETNDLLYEEKLLMMPELTYDLYHRVVPLMNTQITIMNEFSKQIALHLEAVKGIKEGIEEFKNVVRSSKSYPYLSSQDPGNLDNLNSSQEAKPELEDREIPGNLPIREDPERDQKSYPGPEDQNQEKMDKIAIWINGNDTWSDENIDALIEEKTDELTDKLMEIEKQLNRFHTKKVKGKTYWYKVENGKWIYCGKEDPRKQLFKEKTKLEKEKSEIEQKIRSCVIKEAGNHLIIDIKKLKESVNEIPENIVMISEILRG